MALIFAQHTTLLLQNERSTTSIVVHLEEKWRFLQLLAPKLLLRWVGDYVSAALEK